MAFKRRSKTIGGGVRKTVTHNTKTGTTSSSSSKVGNERSTVSILSNGRTRITRTHTSSSGYVTRTSKTSPDGRKKSRAKHSGYADIEWPAEEALGFIGLCVLAVVGYWIYLNWQAVLTVVVISIVVTIIFFSIKNSNKKKVHKQENVVVEKQQRQEVKKSDDELTASDIGWGLMGIGLVSSLIIKFLN